MSFFAARRGSWLVYFHYVIVWQGLFKYWSLCENVLLLEPRSGRSKVARLNLLEGSLCPETRLFNYRDCAAVRKSNVVSLPTKDYQSVLSRKLRLRNWQERIALSTALRLELTLTHLRVLLCVLALNLQLWVTQCKACLLRLYCIIHYKFWMIPTVLCCIPACVPPCVALVIWH